jgi:hypothetical protein
MASGLHMHRYVRPPMCALECVCVCVCMRAQLQTENKRESIDNDPGRGRIKNTDSLTERVPFEEKENAAFSQKKEAQGSCHRTRDLATSKQVLTWGSL